MSRGASVFRRYGMPALGLVAMVVGVILLVVALQPRSSFGWTAYAPLTHTVYHPDESVTPTLLIGAFLAGGGLALTATWIAQTIARRRAGVAASQ